MRFLLTILIFIFSTNTVFSKIYFRKPLFEKARIRYVNILEDGIKEFRKKNYKLALEKFDNCIKFNEDVPAAYINRAQAFIALENYELALNDLNRAIKLNFKDQSVYYLLGKVFYLKKDYDKSLVFLDKAYGLKQDDFSILENIYHIYFLKKDYKNQVRILLLLLKNNKKNIEYIKSIKDAYINLGNYSDAYKYAKQLANFYEDNENFKLEVGIIEFKLGKINNAFRTLSEILLFKTNYSALFYRGKIFFKLGKYERAIQDFNLAVLDKNFKNSSLYNIAISLMRLKEFKRANRYFELIINKDFDNPYILNDYALNLIKLKEYKKADSILKKLVEKHKKMDIIFNNYGYLYYIQKDYKNSLTMYNAALKINPFNMNTKLNYAILMDKTDDKKKALELFISMVSIAKNNPYIFFKIYQLKKHFNEKGFDKFLIKAKKIDPKIEENYTIYE